MLSGVSRRWRRYCRAGSASGAEQALVVLGFGPGHGPVEQLLAIAGGGFGRATGRAGRGGGRGAVLPAAAGPKRDARPFRQHRQGLREGDALHLHHEAEDVAADVADPALERLPLGIDLKAGPGVVVPGTERHVATALAAELDIACPPDRRCRSPVEPVPWHPATRQMTPSAPVCRDTRSPFRDGGHWVGKSLCHAR